MIYWGTRPDRFRSVFEKFGAVLSLQELQKPGVAWDGSSTGAGFGILTHHTPGMFRALCWRRA